MLIQKKLACISKIAAEDSTKHTINGVHVERLKNGSCVASVTDGRRLVQVKWEDDGKSSVKRVKGFSAIVPKQAWDISLKLALNHALLSEAPATAKCDNVQITTLDVGLSHTTSAPAIKGKFPDVSQVIPSYEIGVDASEIGVNLRLLAELLKVVAEVLGKPFRMSLIVPTDPKRPLIIKGDNGEGLEVTAVLMSRSFDKES